MKTTKVKFFHRFLAFALSVIMVGSGFMTTAFAAEPHTHEMIPSKKVFEVGKKSFYKVDGEEIIFADRDEDEGEGDWKAVPSMYIYESEYNEDNIEFGAYLVGDGEVIFVALTECFDDAGTFYYFHGTKDGATVSTDVDTADNTDPTMGTDFYLHIENGVDPDGPSKEDIVKGATGDERISYEFTIRSKASYNINATVPLAVCMYGYRGTGNVITPSEDAYQIKNYSTINRNANATVIDIVKLTRMTSIVDGEHSDENLAAIAYNKNTKQYCWWFSTPEQEEVGALGSEWVYNDKIADEKVNASGEVFVFCDGTNWLFKSSGVLDNGTLRQTVKATETDLSADLELGDWNFGKSVSVGQTAGGADVNEGLAIKITEIQAVPATWKMVPMDTELTDIKRGELAMNIAPANAIEDASAVDLAKASGKIDITARGWFIEAPTMAGDGKEVEEPSVLPLITNAHMAGGNANPSGCTGVVRVTYTVTPIFVVDDSQTSTVIGDTVESNRAA